MLLDAIITVLRETLEAGVLISILISFSGQLSIPYTWLAYGFILGGIGALTYTFHIESISIWNDYRGQELLTASIQFLCCLLLILTMISARRSKAIAIFSLSLICSSALIREGAEIIILFKFLNQHENLAFNGTLSAGIGLIIGFNIGIVLYYLLKIIPSTLRSHVQLHFLALIAGGLSLQACQLLIQADYLQQGAALWNSQRLIDESSVIGQAAFAIFGYESTPSLIEVIAYSLAFFAVLISGYWLVFDKVDSRAASRCQKFYLT